MRVDVNDLATVAEIATALGTSKATVCNWTTRYPDFPEPVTVLAGAKVYRLSRVLAWYGRRWVAP